jgi:hypothetical protein
MAIYKTRWFDRWARKQNLNTRALCEAVREMEAGLYEVDLGGGLLKKRLPVQDKVKAADFARWWRPTRQHDGFSCSAFPRTRAATLTRTKKTP